MLWRKIIFMQQLQYDAPNLMYVFQNLSRGDTPNPPGIETQNQPPSPAKCWLCACCWLRRLQMLINTVACIVSGRSRFSNITDYITEYLHCVAVYEFHDRHQPKTLIWFITHSIISPHLIPYGTSLTWLFHPTSTARREEKRSCIKLSQLRTCTPHGVCTARFRCCRIVHLERSAAGYKRRVYSKSLIVSKQVVYSHL